MAGPSTLLPPDPTTGNGATPTLELRVRSNGGAPAAGILVPQGSLLIGPDSAGLTSAAGEEDSPPHVLVMHGSRRTIVRSLGTAALLNGQPFHEALLRGGDRLSIGPTELEAHSHDPREGAPHPPSSEESGDDQVAFAEAGLAELLLDEPTHAASNDAERQVDREAPPDNEPTIAMGAAAAAAQLAAPAHSAEEAPQPREFQTRAASMESLEERFQRLCEDHDNMARERQRWLGGWNQAEAQLNSCVEQVHRKMAQLREEHEAAGAELQERRRELFQDHDDLTQRFAALDRRLEDFAGQQAAGLAERLAWQEEQRRLHEQLLARSSQIERKLDAVSARQQALEAKRPHAAAEGLKSAGHRDAIDFRLAELRAEREALEEDLRLEQAERARTFLSEPAGEEAPSESSADTRFEQGRASEAPCEPPAPQPAEAEPAASDFTESEPADLATTGQSIPLPPEAGASEPGRDTISLTELCRARWDDRPAADEQDPSPELAAFGVEETAGALTGNGDCEPLEEACPTAVAEEDEIAFVPPSVAPPTTTADVFARLGLQPPGDDEPRPVAPPVRSAPDPASEGEREDESIDQYMARLMDRVRGTGGTTSPAPRSQFGRREVDSSPIPTSHAAPPARVEDPAVAEAPSQPRVRVAPPESAADLSAMRELANLNARQALGSHQQRRVASVMYGKLLLAVVSMVVSFTMIAMAVAGRPLYIFGAMLAATMTAVWSWQYLRLARQLAQAAEQSAAAENRSAELAGAEVVLAEAVPEATADPTPMSPP